MKTYKMKLTGLDGTALAVANTARGLLISYNRYLVDCYCQKITLRTLENEEGVSLFFETGRFDELGNEVN